MDENYRRARARLEQTVAAARKVEIAQVLLLADMIDGAMPGEEAGDATADGVEAEGEQNRLEQQVAAELAPEIARMRTTGEAVECHLLLEVMNLRARFPRAWEQMAQGKAPEWMEIRVEQMFSELGQGPDVPWWSEMV